MHQLDIDTLDMLGAVLRRERAEEPLESLPASLGALIARLGEREAEDATGSDQDS